MAGDAWSNRPLDQGWTMRPDSTGRIRPDGSTEWNLGEGPGGGYSDAANKQSADFRKYAGGLAGGSGQMNRGFQPFLGSQPPDPDSVAPRKTPEWRAAFDRQRNWQVAMAQHGANPADIELQPRVGQGLSAISSWGEILQNAKELADRGDWVDPRKYGSHPEQAFRRTEKSIPKDIDSTTEEGAPTDLWPGNSGMEGSLPQYAAPQYNPVDSWGGWSGVYGASNPLTTGMSNPAGMGSPGLPSPASMGNTGYSGLSNSRPAVLGNNGTSGAQANRPMGRGPIRRNPTQGGSFGGPSLGGGMMPPQPMGSAPSVRPQGMLIRR